MPWIIFDDEDRRTPAPRFCLESVQHEQVCSDDYCEDCSLMLVFPPEHGGEGCADLLASFSSRLSEYASLDAQVLAILPYKWETLVEDPILAGLPFPLLADPGGKVRRSYAGLMDESLVTTEDILLYVLDSYGAPYSAYSGRDPLIPALHEDALNWLEFIGVQCPE